MSLYLAVFLIFCWVQVFSAVQIEYIITINVEHGTSECFFQNITNKKFSAFEIGYQVVNAGERNINFIIKDSQSNLIVSDSRKHVAKHRLNVSVYGIDVFEFCFDNSFSITTRKTIFFKLYLLDENGNYESSYDIHAEKNLALSETYMALTFFERITTKVKNSLNQIEQLQAQHRAIEHRDRAVMEHNLEMVNFWSLISLVVMLLVASVQIYAVRSLFEENFEIGRIIRTGKLN